MEVVLLLITGLGLLLLGGAALVRGASGIAEAYGISPLIVGLTVVAFGTSAPELVVNVIGAIRGQSEIAFGNVAGSNLANLGLVLGFAALITPISIQGQIIRRELPLLLLATTVLVVMCLDVMLRSETAAIDRADGLILLLLFGIFVYITISDFLGQKEDPLLVTVEQITPDLIGNPVVNWLYVVAGCAGLMLGGQLTIDNGVALAARLEVSPAIVGMMVVAIGTSLPELVTSIIAAMRREADLCVGNVIGSNIFNALLVLPVSGLVRPLSIPSGGTIDLLMSLLLALALIPIFIVAGGTMGRFIGAGFIVAYFGYMTARVTGVI